MRSAESAAVPEQVGRKKLSKALRHAQRVGAVATLSGGAILAGSAPAYAHPVLEASTPPSGATVTTAPSVLLFDYDQQVEAGDQSLTGPDGQTLPIVPPTVSDDVVTQPLPPLPQPGEYNVAFRVRGSKDGDVVTETFRFTFAPTAPPDEPPSTAGEDPPTDDSAVVNGGPAQAAAPVHPLLLGFLALTALVLGGVGVAVLVIAAAAGRRRRAAS